MKTDFYILPPASGGLPFPKPPPPSRPGTEERSLGNPQVEGNGRAGVRGAAVPEDPLAEDSHRRCAGKPLVPGDEGRAVPPPPKQNPFAADIPTRRPVNDPGPAETATHETTPWAAPAAAKSPSTAEMYASEACRPGGRAASASTAPPETSATLPRGVADSIARITCSTGQEPGDVVVEDERRQREDEREPHLVRQRAHLRGDRLAHQPFDGEEEQVPAVEDRDREQVEDPEVDAQEAEEVGEGGDPLPGLVPGDLRDEDRAPQRLRREDAGDELHHRHHGQVDELPRLLPRAQEGRHRPRLPVDHVRPRDDPDFRFGELLSEDGAPLPHLGGDGDRRFRTVALHRDPERLAGAPRPDP